MFVQEVRSPVSDITVLLEQAGAGKAQEAALYDRIHMELRQLARSGMCNERRDHSLQPTALVNEAYLRLIGGGPVSWQSRAHFFHAAQRGLN